MSVFTRARKNLNLTPFERAVLKFLEGLALAALLAGWQAIAPLLSNPDLRAVQWSSVLHTGLAAAALAVLAAITKYAKAFGDPALPEPAPSAPSAASKQPGTSNPASATATVTTQAVDVAAIKAAAQTLQQAAA